MRSIVWHWGPLLLVVLAALAVTQCGAYSRDPGSVKDEAHKAPRFQRRSALDEFQELWADAPAASYEADATAKLQSADSLRVHAHLPYKSNEDSPQGCDLLNEACAPLSDVFGYQSKGKGKAEPVHMALVGLVNGVSFVKVDLSTALSADHGQDSIGPSVSATTTPAAALQQVHFEPGCPTEWRDLKVYKDAVYVVTDSTDLCSCLQQPCQLAAPATIGNGQTESLWLSEAPFAPPLAESGVVNATVKFVNTTRANATGCAAYAAHTFDGRIALVERGDCMFTDKASFAQAAGAVALLIINDRDDLVPPSMTGDPVEDLRIPVALITRQDGQRIQAALATPGGGDAARVVVQLGQAQLVENPLLQAPNGLWVFDMSNPLQPRLAYDSTEFFQFAHNIYVEEERGLLYACGMNCLPGPSGAGAGDGDGDDDGDGSATCLNGTIVNGGVAVFDISSPLQPRLLSVWDDAYLHDVVVTTLHGRRTLLGSAIYDGRLYFLDVEDPEHIGRTVVYLTSPHAAHNAWTSADNRYVYLTHEDDAMPVTVWDISDLLDIRFVSNFSFNSANKTIPHNVFVRDHLLWASYYSEGVLVYRLNGDTGLPTLVGHVDTSGRFCNGYHGVWGIYPFEDSSYAYASDIEEGLFVLRFTGNTGDGRSSGKNNKDATVAAVLVIVVVVAALALGYVLQKRGGLGTGFSALGRDGNGNAGTSSSSAKRQPTPSAAAGYSSAPPTAATVSASLNDDGPTFDNERLIDDGDDNL